MDDLTVLTEYFYLININVRHRLIPLEFSIPTIHWIVHREIALLIHHFAPAVEYAERFHAVQSSSTYVKNIIDTIAIGRKSIRYKHIGIFTNHYHLHLRIIPASVSVHYRY